MTEASKELAGVEWKLVAIESSSGEIREPDASVVPTLTFTNDEAGSEARRFAGHGGCNRFFGSYIKDADGRLSIPAPIGATRMACPEPIMDLEGALLRALEQVRSYEIDGNELRMTFEGGTLRFESSSDGL